MSLVKNIEDMASYLPMGGFSFEVISPYIKQIDRDYIINAIGFEQYEYFLKKEPIDKVVLRVYNLLKEASCNLAFLKYIPVGSVQITDAGIMESNNEHSKNADWWKVRDLQKSFRENGLSALDNALKLMEENQDKFPLWIKSNNYTIFKELFVTRTDIFQKYFDINNSRMVFVAFRPLMLDVQEEFLIPFLGEKTVDEIKKADTKQRKRALELAMASQVNFTIWKSTQMGLFHFNENGISLKNKDLNMGKKEKIDNDFLNRLSNQVYNTADEYLKKLKQYILDHKNYFVNFKEKEKSINLKVTNTKSIVGF